MLCQVAGERSRGASRPPLVAARKPSAPAGPGGTTSNQSGPTRPGLGWSGRRRSPPSYPQDAQSAVEMLIIQRSQIAAFSSRGTLAACPRRPYIPSCAEHGAGVGRSNTGRLYGAARKGRSGKSVGVVDETATDSATFFGPPHAAARGSPLDYDRRDGTSASAAPA